MGQGDYKCRRFSLLVCFNRWSWRWLERRLPTNMQHWIVFHPQWLFVMVVAFNAHIWRANLIRPEQTVKNAVTIDSRMSRFWSVTSVRFSRSVGEKKTLCRERSTKPSRKLQQTKQRCDCDPQRTTSIHISVSTTALNTLYRKRKITSRWWVQKKQKLAHFSTQQFPVLARQLGWNWRSMHTITNIDGLIENRGRFCLLLWTQMRQLII